MLSESFMFASRNDVLSIRGRTKDSVRRAMDAPFPVETGDYEHIGASLPARFPSRCNVCRIVLSELNPMVNSLE